MNKKAKAVELPLTQGVITWDPYEYNAQNTTLYTKDLRDSFKEVRYNIWRTADGSESKQTFTSQEKIVILPSTSFKNISFKTWRISN